MGRIVVGLLAFPCKGVIPKCPRLGIWRPTTALARCSLWKAVCADETIDFNQASRGGIVATCEMIRAALPLARLGAALRLRAVLLAFWVLAATGCSTGPPPAAPTILVPPPSAVEEPTRASTWTARPKPTEADPRIAELKAWYRALGEAGPVRGLSRTSLDERNHRIKIKLLPLRGARDQMEAAIVRANVPREAVVIDVG